MKHGYLQTLLHLIVHDVEHANSHLGMAKRLDDVIEKMTTIVTGVFNAVAWSTELLRTFST